MDTFIWSPSNDNALWVGQEDEAIHVGINIYQRVDQGVSDGESVATVTRWPIPTSIRWSSNIEFPEQVIFTEGMTPMSLHIDGPNVTGITPINIQYMQDDFSTYTDYKSWSLIPATNGELISYRTSGVSVHHIDLSVTCVGVNENLAYYGNNHIHGIPGPAGLITEETKVYRISVYSNFTTGARALKAAVHARHKP